MRLASNNMKRGGLRFHKRCPLSNPIKVFEAANQIVEINTLQTIPTEIVIEASLNEPQ